ncbi:TPA: hypothetical protein QFT23_005213, partial [Bacillus cereus]|nr:hypothetical protein [Bacillus cereus]
GDTGPTGSTGAAGSTVNNASFYLSANTNVATNTRIPFDLQNTLNGTGITNSLGAISLSANTTYCIAYNVELTDTTTFFCALFFNGTVIPGTTVGTNNGAAISSGVIFNTGAVGNTLEVRNISGTTQNFAGGECNIRIFQLS